MVARCANLIVISMGMTLSGLVGATKSEISKIEISPRHRWLRALATGARSRW